MMGHDIYALIMSLITPKMLWLLSALVAAGWIWRLRLRVSYSPPKVTKFTAALVFMSLSYFYLIVDYADWPTDHYQALSRVVFLLLLIHEIMHHLYMLWVYRRINGKTGVV